MPATVQSPPGLCWCQREQGSPRLQVASRCMHAARQGGPEEMREGQNGSIPNMDSSAGQGKVAGEHDETARMFSGASNLACLDRIGVRSRRRVLALVRWAEAVCHGTAQRHPRKGCARAAALGFVAVGSLCHPSHMAVTLYAGIALSLPQTHLFDLPFSLSPSPPSLDVVCATCEGTLSLYIRRYTSIILGHCT